MNDGAQIEELADPAALALLVKAAAARLGFAACGITTAAPFPEAEAAMLERIGQGFLDGMPWFTRERAHLACTPEELLPGARSLVVLAAPYRTVEPEAAAAEEARGRVARYAWGDDYHDVVKRRMAALVDVLTAALGRVPARRLFVDSSPLAERAAAQRAGVGWFGKNTMILLPGQGSYFFLCAVLLDVELATDQPLRKSCGSCDLCLRACPTDAFAAPYVLDANRCIAYLTIEHRGAVPDDLRPLVGEQVFGCDICQEVCPVNRKGGPIGWPEFSPRDGLGTRPPLADLLGWNDVEYRQTLRGSPLKRAKLRGLKRNAAVAAGAARDSALTAPLVAALADADALVRGHAAWALGQIGGAAARSAVEEARQREPDPGALAEMTAALAAAAR